MNNVSNLAVAQHGHGVAQLRIFLRSETDAVHQLLDSKFARFPLSNPAGYRKFLSAQMLAWQALDAAWRQAVPGLLGRAAPDYVAMLAADLSDLGFAPPAPMTGDMLTRPVEQAGLVYVLAGSRLGNAAIARTLDAGHSPLCAHRFLRDRTGLDIFRDLLAYFDSGAGRAVAPDKALQTARECFATFMTAAEIIGAAR